jgi:RNA polymerase sigma-70 factor (ECF subfamily)
MSDHLTHRGDCFVTTRWTMILEAGRKSSPNADKALEELCQTYWYPLYAYVRGQGRSKEDAEDLVQGFFASFLGKNYFEQLQAENGKFRAFLLASLKHYLANEWDKARRQKRGGAKTHLSLDWHQADERFLIEPSGVRTPDQDFDRHWTLALLDRVIGRLREECEKAGRATLFHGAKQFLLVAEGSLPYSTAAAGLEMQEGTLRVAVHRLRKRYRELLKEEIAQTLARPEDVQVELRALLTSLA